jgi:aspartate ammonia-lyase
MARKAKTDRELMPQRVRLSKIKSVRADYKANDEVSVAKLDATIKDSERILDEYNQMLSAIDAKSNEYDASIKKGANIGALLLDAVGIEYGKDSDEYEMAGGTRTSERKRPVRTAKPKP